MRCGVPGKGHTGSGSQARGREGGPRGGLPYSSQDVSGCWSWAEGRGAATAAGRRPRPSRAASPGAGPAAEQGPQRMHASPWAECCCCPAGPSFPDVRQSDSAMARSSVCAADSAGCGRRPSSMGSTSASMTAWMTTPRRLRRLSKIPQCMRRSLAAWLRIVSATKGRTGAAGPADEGEFRCRRAAAAPSAFHLPPPPPRRQ